MTLMMEQRQMRKESMTDCPMMKGMKHDDEKREVTIKKITPSRSKPQRVKSPQLQIL